MTKAGFFEKLKGPAFHIFSKMVGTFLENGFHYSDGAFRNEQPGADKKNKEKQNTLSSTQLALKYDIMATSLHSVVPPRAERAIPEGGKRNEGCFFAV